MIDEAVAKLELWLDTVHLGGPSIGYRGESIAYCGPGYDWRYAWLVDAWSERYRVSQERKYVQSTLQAIQEFSAAQCGIGCFRCSGFDYNPLECGGNEPLALAAFCRAIKWAEEGKEQLLSVVQKYVEKYLLARLWNRSLQAFNDRVQSGFTLFSSLTQASAILLLEEYRKLGGEDVTRYIKGAGKALLSLRKADGAFSLTNKNRKTVPLYSAICLDALPILGEEIGETNPLLPDEGEFPLGAQAGKLDILLRHELVNSSYAEEQIKRLLQYQTPMGTFAETAWRGWRRALPSVAWQAMIYSLLAKRSRKVVDTTIEPYMTQLRVGWKRAEYQESEKSIEISSSRKVWYLWNKGEAWAQLAPKVTNPS